MSHTIIPNLRYLGVSLITKTLLSRWLQKKIQNIKKNNDFFLKYKCLEIESMKGSPNWICVSRNIKTKEQNVCVF